MEDRVKGALEQMVQLCAGIMSCFTGNTPDEVFAEDDVAEPVVKRVRKLGQAALLLPEEAPGHTPEGKVSYLRAVGTVLEKADTNIAHTFCKHDISTYEGTCKHLLAQECDANVQAGFAMEENLAHLSILQRKPNKSDK